MLREQISRTIFTDALPAGALDLSLVDPMLRDVVEATNRSGWLRTEFSCSGWPDDHSTDSEGTLRRWGSYTAGEMYIAYICPRVTMNRVLWTAISQASESGLPLTIRLSLGSGDVGDACITAPVAHFAIAVNYEPADSARAHKALGVFARVAAMAG